MSKPEKITDDQLRSLRSTLLKDGIYPGDLCDGDFAIALGEERFDDIGRFQAMREARARCAAAYNARHAPKGNE